MHASLRRCGLGDRVTLVGPDAAVWTTAETHWVSRTADELGDAVGIDVGASVVSVLAE